MGSKSSSTTSTTTQQYDQRVVADAGATVVSSGGTLTFIDEFPEDVKSLVYDVLSFAGGVGEAALDVTHKSFDVAQRSLDGVVKSSEQFGERLQSIEQGGADKFIGIAAVVVIVVVAVMAFRKNK